MRGADRDLPRAFLPRLLQDVDGASVRQRTDERRRVGAIALFVLVEKTVPWGNRMSQLTGELLVVWGAAGLIRLI